ncbi:MAG: hypothetical protein KC635_12475 [Myxococcales bacterium]|nr:hypothetical protein [Myxococcales bacterium]
MVVGDVVLALLTAVGALVLVVLLVPISARARGVARETELALEAVVAWGFGVLAYRWQARQGGSFHVLGIRVWRSGAETAEAKRARREKAAARKAARAEKRAAKGKEKKGGKRRSPGRLWRSRRALWRALLRVLGALHVRGRVEGVVGLADPDDTMWIGLALGELEARLPEGVLAVDVDYTDEVLDLAGRLRSTVWPIEAVVVLLAVWARAEVRRALRAA